MLDTGIRLPYHKVELLKEGNGVVVKMGDSSDPTALEIEFCYPDWAERNEIAIKVNSSMIEVFNKLLPTLVTSLELNSKQIEGFSKFMKQFSVPKRKAWNPEHPFG